MKSKVLIVLLGLCCFCTVASAQEDTTELVEEYLFIDYEVYAKPPGGTDSLVSYLAKNFACKNRCQECPLSGRMYIQFYVEIDGSLAETEVVRGEDSGCADELITLLKAFGPWSPAVQNGRPVRAKYIFPVYINFE